jgi:N utilization substance protein A
VEPGARAIRREGAVAGSGREVYIDDETREATVIVPDDQLALAIGKEGLNARLAARLTGWKVDIQSDTEFAQAEAEAAFAGADGDDFTGRCVAILSTGKRCPNAALPGSRFCGVPAHQELAKRDEAGEDLGDLIVKPGVVEAEDEGDDATADAAAAVSASQDEAEAADGPAGTVPDGNAETVVAVSEETESAT